MTKKIGVKNFRVFKDYTEFEIRPITLLVGPNNSGKSSFTKLLRLIENGFDYLRYYKGKHNLKDYESSLNYDSDSKKMVLSTIPNLSFLGPENKVKYTYESGDIIQTDLYLGSTLLLSIKEDLEPHDLGDYHKVLNNKNYFLNINALIEFVYNKEFFLNQEGNENKDTPFYYLFQLQKKSYFNELNKSRDLTDIKLDEFNNLGKDFFEINPTISYKHLRIQALYNEIDSLEKDYLLFDVYVDGELVTSNFKNVILAAQNSHQNYLLEQSFFFYGKDDFPTWIAKGIKKSIEEELIDTLPNIKVTYSRLGKIIFKYLFLNYKNEKSSLIEALVNFNPVHNAFKDIRYLSPIKSHNNRVLESNSAFALDSLVHNYDNSIKEMFVGKERERFIKDALKLFGIKGELEVNIYEDYIATVKFNDGKRKTLLNDLGYGYSQLLALSLFITDNYEDRSPLDLDRPISIIEEPEANLHPNLQSKIADLFNLYFHTFPDGKRNNFVIETHSEYLIRKFQYLVAKGELNPKDIIIHYFNSEEHVSNEEPKVKHIEINRSGTLSDTFGPGFYDEAIKLQFDLLNINKEQNN